ncbi:MAG TPA: amidohydrolase family protein, partial [Candidatus Limnocylindrales bacterium]|nr:amidohydrolase family protein [Candidatus Limnocylindrales bacterium]
MPARGVDLVVRGGRVVTAAEAIDASVAVKDGVIVAIGRDEAMPPAERTIDATGKVVLPGLIDCHVHLGAVYDDWDSGPRAAAHAGITTLLAFAEYDDQKRETLPQAIKRLREEAEKASVVDFGFHFILNNEDYILDELPEAVRLGVSSFKLFMTYKKRPKRMCSDEFIAKVMERLAGLGGLCQLHCENGDILYHLETKAIAEGRVKPVDFPATCPPWTEEEAINRAIRIGAMTGCPVYVVHLSTQVGLERIKQAQREGQRVWTETCPQYLLLTDHEM